MINEMKKNKRIAYPWINEEEKRLLHKLSYYKKILFIKDWNSGYS